jgi:monoterpene epsilon-lactone hydrolase
MTSLTWLELKTHIKAHPVDGSPEEMRAAFGALSPPGPPGRDRMLGGMPCVAFGPEAGLPVVWMHGGGLVFGSPATHAAMVSRIAELVDRPVICPAYRLAPEHKWPAPLDDLLAVLDALPEGVDLGGDSVGGQLALLAALRRPGRIRRLTLVSPNTDRTGRSTTRDVDTDAMNDDAGDRALARLSFGPDLSAHPDASPLLADLSALPPMWITAATSEVLLDDTLLLIAELGRASVAVTAEICPGLCHLWVLWCNALPEARASVAALAAFLAAPD